MAERSGAAARNTHLPGEVGVWGLVLGDALLFGVFFITYLAYRSQDPGLYQFSQGQLDAHLGVLNTLLLLTSSWCVVSALQAVRRQREAVAARLLRGAMVCGLGFALIKMLEYGLKIGQGITPLSNDFFMFYFVLTGIHLFHLLVGLGVLAYMLHVVKPGLPAAHRLGALESGATFWHLVDLLWIILFPLLYLLP